MSAVESLTVTRHQTVQIKRRNRRATMNTGATCFQFHSSRHPLLSPPPNYTLSLSLSSFFEIPTISSTFSLFPELSLLSLSPPSFSLSNNLFRVIELKFCEIIEQERDQRFYVRFYSTFICRLHFAIRKLYTISLSNAYAIVSIDSFSRLGFILTSVWLPIKFPMENLT